MSEKTKSCNLTEDEVKMLIMSIGREMDEENIGSILDRINYLNNRLKSFNENQTKPATTGWPTNG